MKIHPTSLEHQYQLKLGQMEKGQGSGRQREKWHVPRSSSI